MVMTRKKRRAVLITVILSIILLIAVIMTILYLTTDSFKSSQFLFSKYIVNIMPTIESLSNKEHMTEMEEILQNNKYESNIDAKSTYSNTDGDSTINDLNLQINSQVDRVNKYNYRTIEVNKNEDENTLFRMEYINNDNIYGIKLEGIKQFVSTDLSKTDNQNNKVKIIDDLKQINLNDYLKFSNEEKTTLKNNYLNILDQNTSKANYTKQRNASVSINGNNYNANSYSLTLSKENMNKLYVAILQNLKEDEIVLSKLDNIDEKLNEYYAILENNMTSNLKVDFVNYIEEKIRNIEDTNIGNEEKRITVYESNGQTICINIESNEATYTINSLKQQNTTMAEFKWVKNTQNENDKENSFDIKIEKNANKNDETFNIICTQIKDGEEIVNEFMMNRKFENNNANINIQLQRKNSKGDLKVEVQDNITIVNEFKDNMELNQENNIILEDIDEGQKENIISILKENVNNQKENLNSVISKEDFDNILIDLNLKQKEVENIESEGNTTETEKTRFNSAFELYQGDQIKKESVLNLVNVSKDSLENVEITKYKEKSSGNKNEPLEYKLSIKKNNKNEELATRLYNTINESRENTYTVKVEYDQETGLVNTVYITVYED